MSNQGIWAVDEQSAIEAIFEKHGELGQAVGPSMGGSTSPGGLDMV